MSRKLCHKCKGSGTVTSNKGSGTVTCNACHGSGWGAERTEREKRFDWYGPTKPRNLETKW